MYDKVTICGGKQLTARHGKNEQTYFVFSCLLHIQCVYSHRLSEEGKEVDPNSINIKENEPLNLFLVEGGVEGGRGVAI